MIKCISAWFSEGGANGWEVCSAHHRSWFGARVLRSGAGPGSPLHDQEGPDQHRRSGRESAPAAWTIPLCEDLCFFLLNLCVFLLLNPSSDLGSRCVFSSQKKVIVIGAGAAGLAAARQLQNFGTQVEIRKPLKFLCLIPALCSRLKPLMWLI